MTRENNKIKKPKSKFFKIYVGVLIFLAVLLIAALIVLNALLRDFESVQPKYLAAEMFSQYFTDDTSALVDAIKSTSGGFESEEILRGYVDQAMSGGALSYYEVSSGVKKEWIKYVVKSGDKSIFNFTLVEQDERSSFGFKKYKFGEIQAPSGKLAVKCAVPEGYSLYLNGIQVGSDHLTGEERRISSFKYLPEGLTAPKEDVYEIKGLFCEPAVTADNGKGKAVDVNYIEEEGVYEAVLAYDEELEAEFSEYVIKAAEAYATYMQNDAGFRTAARYLDPTPSCTRRPAPPRPDLYGITTATISPKRALPNSLASTTTPSPAGSSCSTSSICAGGTTTRSTSTSRSSSTRWETSG
ncbi:MAG: hypothetical protein IJR90_02415 [Clostridia bacterium]|nr:hypothetical protein [Clostridia bacterium]